MSLEKVKESCKKAGGGGVNISPSDVRVANVALGPGPEGKFHSVPFSSTCAGIGLDQAFTLASYFMHGLWPHPFPHCREVHKPYIKLARGHLANASCLVIK